MPRVLDAIAARFGYNPAVDGTKGQFAKVQTVKWATAIVRQYEGQLAADAAKQTAETAVITDIVIT